MEDEVEDLMALRPFGLKTLFGYPLSRVSVAPFELFNLREDPRETTDVSAAHPAIYHSLLTALRAHIQRGGAVPWQKRVD